MAVTAVALALGAAVLHALWNLMIARAEDTQAATALALAIGVLVATPFAILRWDVQPEAWPFIAASSALELIYVGLLTTAYRRSELSLVYPLARGVAPVIVLVVSVLVLGAATSLTQAAGVALVGAGVLLVRGVRGPGRPTDLVLGLAIAAAIAAYTLVDAAGVRHADPIAYVTAILVGPALVSVAVVEARGRGRLRRAWSAVTIAGGIASIAAYALVLVALTLAPAAPVAAVREVSVVIATVLAVPILGEPVGARRLIGAVVVTVGVALVVSG